MAEDPLREEIKKIAREMRSRPTEAEAALWKALRRKQLGGFRFRCQHIIDPLIVDFYCPSIRVVIEVDGPIHKRHKSYDKVRTRWLEEKGYCVIRFEND